MNDPWSKAKLNLHLTQRLRERVNILLEWDVADDNLLVPVLREDDENAIWQVLQEAIEEAGWHMVKKDKFIEDTIELLKDNPDAIPASIRLQNPIRSE